MGNIPVAHELSTACQSLGALVINRPDKAGEVWEDYAAESVIGSSVYAGALAVDGNHIKAEEMLKGCGRATGQALLGGGLFSDIPIFKELSKCGKSLGDVIGGGDDEQAAKRWTEEYLQEVTDPTYLQKAGVSIVSVACVTVVSVCTAGLGTAAFYGTVATVGATAAGAENVSKQYIDKCVGKRDHVDAGQVFGSAAAGGIFAASCAGIATYAVVGANEAVAGANKAVVDSIADGSAEVGGAVADSLPASFQSTHSSVVDASFRATCSSGSSDSLECAEDCVLQQDTLSANLLFATGLDGEN